MSSMSTVLRGFVIEFQAEVVNTGVNSGYQIQALGVSCSHLRSFVSVVPVTSNSHQGSVLVDRLILKTLTELVHSGTTLFAQEASTKSHHLLIRQFPSVLKCHEFSGERCMVPHSFLFSQQDLYFLRGLLSRR